jgi:hypothetical protein
MKNTTNTLKKLTKLLAVAIISVSLNAFSVVLQSQYKSPDQLQQLALQRWFQIIIF